MRTNQLIASVFLAAGANLILSISLGAGEPAQSGSAGAQTLRIGYLGNPFSFDPLATATVVEREVLTLLYSRLFEPTPDGRRFRKGNLLESYRIIEGFRGNGFGASTIEYELRLRPTAKFSDGTTVTAYDVVATVEALRRNDHFEIGRYMIGAVAVDSQCVRIQLREYPAPERLMSFPVAMRNSRGSSPSPFRSVIETGEFHIVQRAGNDSLEMEKTTSLHRSINGNITRIAFRNFPDAETLTALEDLNRGSIDMLLGIRSANMDVSKLDADRFHIRELSSNSVWVLAFNYRSAIFASRPARRAALLALDTAGIARSQAASFPVANGPVVAPTGPFPPNSAANDPALRPRPQNKIVAKSLAGTLSKLDETQLVLLVPYPNVQLEEIAARIARDLNEVGFRVTVDVDRRPLPRGIPDKTRRFDLLLFRIEHDPSLRHLAGLFDPASPLLSESETNILGYAPPALLQQFVDLRREQDADEIARIQHRLHRYFYDDISFVPLWCESRLGVWSKRLLGPATEPIRCYAEGESIPLFHDIANWKLN